MAQTTQPRVELDSDWLGLPPASTPERPGRRRGKRWGLALAGVLLVGLLGTAAGMLGLFRMEEPDVSLDDPLVTIAPLTAGEIVVCERGRGHFSSLTEAVQKAQAGMRIRVQPGVYKGGLVLDKKLEIAGDGKASDIVVECTESDCLQMQTESAVVRGLALRSRAGLQNKKGHAVNIASGQLLLEDCDIASDSLACVAIHGPTARPTLRRCKIHESPEAGIHVFEKAAGLMEQCDICDNAVAGVQVTTGGDPVLRNCQVHQGRGAGILVSEGGKGTVEKCDIAANQAAGVEVNKKGRPLFRNCRIHNGQREGILVTDQGAGEFIQCDLFKNFYTQVVIKGEGNPVLRGCEIYDGSSNGVCIAEKGQGEFLSCNVFKHPFAEVVIKAGGNPILRKCTISRSQKQGVLVLKGGQGTVEDCQIVQNTEDGIWVEEGDGPVFSLCHVNHNGKRPISVVAQSKVTVQDCDLTGNPKPAYVARDCPVTARGNQVDPNP